MEAGNHDGGRAERISYQIPGHAHPSPDDGGHEKKRAKVGQAGERAEETGKGHIETFGDVGHGAQ